MKKVMFLILLCWAQLAPLSLAQHTNHTAPAPSNIIDGSSHPELVPDSVAYRLYFVTASELPNAATEAQQRQLSHLGRIGLHAGDLQETIAILNEFKVEYSALIAEYNATATAADVQGIKPDLAGFLKLRDALVQTTRVQLKQKLSLNGMTQFDAFVQSEKKHMKVAVEEAQ